MPIGCGLYLEPAYIGCGLYLEPAYIGCGLYLEPAYIISPWGKSSPSRTPTIRLAAIWSSDNCASATFVPSASSKRWAKFRATNLCRPNRSIAPTRIGRCPSAKAKPFRSRIWSPP